MVPPTENHLQLYVVLVLVFVGDSTHRNQNQNHLPKPPTVFGRGGEGSQGRGSCKIQGNTKDLRQKMFCVGKPFAWGFVVAKYKGNTKDLRPKVLAKDFFGAKRLAAKCEGNTKDWWPKRFLQLWGILFVEH